LALKKTRTIIPIIGDGELEMNNANCLQIKKGFRIKSSETLAALAPPILTDTNTLLKRLKDICELL
jgi:hypothetical protein